MTPSVTRKAAQAQKVNKRLSRRRNVAGVINQPIQHQQHINDHVAAQKEETAAFRDERLSVSAQDQQIRFPQQLHSLQTQNARSQQLLENQTVECDNFHTDKFETQQELAHLAFQLQVAEDTIRRERDSKAAFDIESADMLHRERAIRVQQEADLENEWIEEVEASKTLNRQIRSDLEDSVRQISAHKVNVGRLEQELSRWRYESDKENDQLRLQLNEKDQLVSQLNEEKEQLSVQLNGEKDQLVSQLNEEKDQLRRQLNKEKDQLASQLNGERVQLVARHEQEQDQLRRQSNEKDQRYTIDQGLICQLRSQLRKAERAIDDLTVKQQELNNDIETHQMSMR
ncbi:hypothetical protein N0V95_006014 [Ascochyta clinopodiicola]|nr:hypothetical protein N0V95_006014 [Ascochyta clinopodiicola]